jgi:hypothetical protein
MVLDVRVFQGQEIESDHFLLERKIRHWPRTYKRKYLHKIEDTDFKVHVLQDSSIWWLQQQHPSDILNSATKFKAYRY